jgi:hypothetical protein
MTAVDSRFGSAAVGAPLVTPDIPVPPSPEDGHRRKLRRRLVVAALALAALFGAYTAGRLVESHGRVAVWMTVRDLAPGTPVTPADVRLVEVDKAPAGALPAGGPPTGVVANTPVHAGAVLRGEDLSAGALPVPGPGQTLVGLAAIPGRVPDGLRGGDRVQVVALPPEPVSGKPPGKPAVFLADVAVQRVVVTTQGTTVTLVVPAKVAATVAGLSAANRVALVGLPLD